MTTIRQADTVDRIRSRIEAAPARSAWRRGVKAYALELLENWEASGFEYLDELSLLGGAEDWGAYSWNGCSLIFNDSIARRLCTPSELRRTYGGRRRPNAREDWLDVQTRALYQAAWLVLESAREEAQHVD